MIITKNEKRFSMNNEGKRSKSRNEKKERKASLPVLSRYIDSIFNSRVNFSAFNLQFRNAFLIFYLLLFN